MIPFIPKEKFEELGKEAYGLLSELFPICRSITGNGVRRTLEILGDYLPLEVIEVPSGTPVFDWTVPDEWNINDAYILDPEGRKVVDFRESNLHLVGYSVPVDEKITLEELKPHIHTLPDIPDAIPYLTSYYKRDWGFCMRHKDFVNLKDGTYTVKIDSALKPGSLTIGECVLPGELEEEILLSCYTCHPSQANDGLSGVVMAAVLGKFLSQVKRRFTYRIIFIPETIGSITYLSLNRDEIFSKLRAGLVITFVGNDGKFRYKKSRRGNTEIDRVVQHVMENILDDYEVWDFFPDYGSDERQYCSPGFNLPVGLLSRVDIQNDFLTDCAQYHTSLDNPSWVSPENFSLGLRLLYEILLSFELNRSYVNRIQYGEPFLSKRNLVSLLGSRRVFDQEAEKIRWVLNFSDGEHDLLDIAEKMSLPVRELARTVDTLIRAELIGPK